MRCPSCGTEGEGNFCTRCGASLSEDERSCAGCGAQLGEDDRFCGDCGEPTSRRSGKPFSARLSWILSGLLLVAFSVGIAFFVQRWTSPREPGGMITGGIPPAEGREAAGDGAGSDATGAMPSAAEIAAMPPRAAADRLFERAMTEGESDDAERAAFFARMGLQAYARVPPAEMDDDARFHVGLLHLASGDLDAARAVSGELLDDEPEHLLGLVLAARVAEAARDPGAAAGYRERLRSALEGGVSPDEPPYAPHAALIRREAATAGG